MSVETETAKFVRPVTCRRCKGAGGGDGWRPQGGVCFRCDGLGIVEGDRATIAARKAAEAERKAFWSAVGDYSTLAYFGLTLLTNTEPERAVKAQASWVAGRTDVMDALVEYGRQWRRSR